MAVWPSVRAIVRMRPVVRPHVIVWRTGMISVRSFHLVIWSLVIAMRTLVWWRRWWSLSMWWRWVMRRRRRRRSMRWATFVRGRVSTDWKRFGVRFLPVRWSSMVAVLAVFWRTACVISLLVMLWWKLRGMTMRLPHFRELLLHAKSVFLLVTMNLVEHKMSSFPSLVYNSSSNTL